MASDAEQAAFDAAASMVRNHGIWPGVVRAGTGYRLTCELEYGPAAEDTSGPAIAGLGANQICPPADLQKEGGKSDLPPESTERATP